MKLYFKYLSIALAILTFTSCVVDDDVLLGDITGPNLAGFAKSSKVISGISSGEEYDNEIVLEVKGPSWEEMSGDVVVTVNVDPASTAVEGTHFRFDSKTLTLSEANNYIGKLPITMLTEGIVAPLDESPELILNVESATGENVINNGKPLNITFNYLCFSDLSGEYTVQGRYVRSSQGIDTTFSYDDVITEVATGEYRTAMVGHWGDLGVGDPGFTFYDVCNTITIPEQYLVNFYSNIVKGVAGNSSVNPDTGVITFEYTICAGDCREYYITYTPKN